MQLITTPVGQKDIVKVEQNKEQILVVNPEWKVTMLKAVKVAAYSIATIAIGIAIQAITDSTHPYVVAIAVPIVALIRIGEGALRFHLTGETVK